MRAGALRLWRRGNATLSSPVSLDDKIMKTTVFAALLLTAALPLAAQEAETPSAPKLSQRAEQLISDSLPTCDAEHTVKRSGLVHKLPNNMVGTVIRVESKRSACEGQWVAVISNEGTFYMGVPWFLDNVEGQTLEEKLKAFTYKNLQEVWEPVIDRTQRSKEGLYRATLYETSERGKVPFTGWVDPAGSMIFLGNWYPLSAEVKTSRVKALEPYLSAAPSEGAASPKVTVIEFSDFECPSCQRAAGYLKPILAKHGDQVRYIRYDLPLVTMHPWAFSAAVAGRAVHKQKPELFWAYKEQVYANQDKLTAFTIDDFARNFAKDHDLNIEKYDADVNDAALHKQLIDGVGAAFGADVRATPTYVVNGVTVDAGNEGKALETYVEKLLTAPSTPSPAKTSASSR
jgi:protein-disulfide isomerase